MAPKQITDDYYEILQVSQNADESTIRSNYLRLAKRYHPDKDGDNETATARFQLINDAYSTLKDPEKRKHYDSIYPSIVNLRRSQGEPTGYTSNQPQADTEPRGASATEASSGTERTYDDLDQELRDVQLRIAKLNKTIESYQDNLQQNQAELTLVQLRLQNIQSVLKKSNEEQKDDNVQVGWCSFLFRRRAEDADSEKEWTKRGRMKAQTRNVCMSQLNEIIIEIERLETMSSIHNIMITIAQGEKEMAIEEEKIKKEEVARAKLARQQREREEAAKARDEHNRTKRNGEKKKSPKTPKQDRPSDQKAGTTFSSRQSCLHAKWWPEISGQFTCEQCSDRTRWFAFQCPSCSMVVCAKCRHDLKN